MIILPRQARDKHRESTQKERCVSRRRESPPQPRPADQHDNPRPGHENVRPARKLDPPLLRRERHGGTFRKQAHLYLLRHFILKLIILPRQARDKHRGSSEEVRCLTGARHDYGSHAQLHKHQAFTPGRADDDRPFSDQGVLGSRPADLGIPNRMRKRHI